VRDRLTGLIWEVKTDDGGLRDKDLVYTLFERTGPNDASTFLQQVNAEGLCGANDWRIPDRRELASILDFGADTTTEPAIDNAWFPNTVRGDYWTSSQSPGESQAAYFVSFGFAVDGTFDRNFRKGMRLVRGRYDTASRFDVRDDKVLDRSTGLLWDRCSQGQTWTGQTCAGEVEYLGWRQALDRANAVAAATGRGWRLPNAQELSSLLQLNVSRFGIRIDQAVFPSTDDGRCYWASTPARSTARVSDAPSTHCIAFGLGWVSYDEEEFPNPVRLVRALR
jgi:hypothetical protein